MRQLRVTSAVGPSSGWPRQAPGDRPLDEIRAHQTGFTFLEVLVALVLLALIALVVSRGMAVATLELQQQKIRTHALLVAQQKMEEALGALKSGQQLPTSGLEDSIYSYRIDKAPGALNTPGLDQVIVTVTPLSPRIHVQQVSLVTLYAEGVR